MRRLRRKGAQVSYANPHVPNLTELGTEQRTAMPLGAAALAAADAAVVLTPHTAFDLKLIRRNAALVLDTGLGSGQGLDFPGRPRRAGPPGVRPDWNHEFVQGQGQWYNG